MAQQLSRRQLLQAFVGAGLAIAAGCSRDSGDEIPTADSSDDDSPIVPRVEGYVDDQRWAGRTLVVATPGDEDSDYLIAQIEAMFEPFQRLTGATIRTARVDIDELYQQVNAGDVIWSVCDVPAEEVLPLANSAIISEIDYSAVDSANLFEAFVLPHGVGVSLYATVLAHFDELEVDTGSPGDWEDFWDVTEYPGIRGFQETPIGTLEFALLASGVSMAKLYPLDVDAAFEKLDEIMEQILLWWRQGAQPSQMIAAGDLAMVAVWHDRILALVDGGAPVGFTWNQSQINGNCWVVPNGAPEQDLAMDFINFATRPEVCAAFSRLFPFGPINSKAFDALEDDARSSLPGSPGIADQQFVIDLEWWFRNSDVISERFEEWLAQDPEEV